MSGDDGAALVEFALMFPVLAAFLLGTVSAGSMYNRKLALSTAVREGARYGGVMPIEQIFTSGTWATNVRTMATRRANGEVQSANVCVSLVSGLHPVPLTPEHSTKADGKACFDDFTAGDASRRVQVTMTASGRIDAGLFSIPVVTKLHATAKHEDAG